MAFGLPYDEALKAITLNPAEIWGVADSWARSMWERRRTWWWRMGILWTSSTDVKQVFINGRESSDDEPADGAAGPVFGK